MAEGIKQSKGKSPQNDLVSTKHRIVTKNLPSNTPWFHIPLFLGFLRHQLIPIEILNSTFESTSQNPSNQHLFLRKVVSTFFFKKDLELLKLIDPPLDVRPFGGKPPKIPFGVTSPQVKQAPTQSAIRGKKPFLRRGVVSLSWFHHIGPLRTQNVRSSSRAQRTHQPRMRNNEGQKGNVISIRSANPIPLPTCFI
eukprot:TRINITY_DN10270_c0_g4_i1.p1 TRINITY_DN10270_c0_g4~~TRINITY_DN10270_c0_g4_i1.p1  ORF type:complete len:195 (+),score=8.82 TRINITY_DN10270_c0_g4_i1:528-1112(+)